MTEATVLAVGLNAVVQKTLVLPRFVPGAVNRAEELITTVGGKGYHFAKAAHRLVPGMARVAHVLGGETGDYIAATTAAHGLPQLTQRIAARSRVCTTVLCRASGQMTELIEPSPTVTPAEDAALRRQLAGALPGLRGLALCGTVPPGVGGDLYAWLLATAAPETLIVVDAYQDVADVLASGRVHLLKINAHELRVLTGVDDLAAAMTACRAQWRLPCLGITDGGEAAWLQTDEGTVRYELPPLAGLLNPIGAGDTVSAVTLVRLLAGRPPVEAFAWGLAAASASCQHLEGAVFEPSELQHLLARLDYRPV